MDVKRNRREDAGTDFVRQPDPPRRKARRAAEGALGGHDPADVSEAVRSFVMQLTARVDELAGDLDRSRRPAEEKALAARAADLSEDVRSVIAHLSARVDELTGDLAQARQRVLELETLADEDTLLPVLNRRGFMRELGRAISFIGRYDTTAALIYADIDRLKYINDSYGHAAGNTVLQAVAKRIRNQVRASDLIGRLGGDEFAIVLWALSPEDAERKALALAAAVAGEPVNVDGLPITATISAGATALSPTDTAEKALKRADEAMYRAKRRRG